MLGGVKEGRDVKKIEAGKESFLLLFTQNLNSF
jgi:hypothetical protein